MLFWKKNKAKEIIKAFSNILKLTKTLFKFEYKKSRTHELIQVIKANIAMAKEDILGVAEEMKSRPWIDAKYDDEIDSLAQQEVNVLEKLRQDIDAYEDLVTEARDEKQLNYVIMELLQEESRIREREEQNEKTFKNMEDETIRSRLMAKSYKLPLVNTRDGIAWQKISIVIRQLGAWLEPAKKRADHFAKIVFSNGEKISCSEDLGSGRLASQVIEKLRKFMPNYKIPSSGQLKNAFNKGDLHYAI